MSAFTNQIADTRIENDTAFGGAVVVLTVIAVD
jgi:hypothetical protein